MRIALIRHPRTKAGESGRFPNGGEEYSKEGLEQFHHLLSVRPEGILYSSDMPRCLRLAKALSEKYGRPLRTEPLLREIDLGEFSGKTFAEIEASYPEAVEEWMSDPEQFTYPGGESFPDFRERIRAFLSRLRSPSSTLITHQGVIHVVLRELLGETAPAEPIDCAQEIVLESTEGKWRFCDPAKERKEIYVNHHLYNETPCHQRTAGRPECTGQLCVDSDPRHGVDNRL